jgi:hypothetical protein
VIKFAVTTTRCTTVSSATLRLTDNANGSVKGGDFHTTGTAWNESTVTYGNSPARGTLLASLGAVTSGGTHTVDVTRGVSALNGSLPPWLHQRGRRPLLFQGGRHHGPEAAADRRLHLTKADLHRGTRPAVIHWPTRS